MAAGRRPAARTTASSAEEEAVKAQWAQVENQLQRRNDLIPNLVETTKGFAQQERDVFQAIADSRAKLAGAQTTEQKIAGRQRAVLGALAPAGRRRKLPAAQVERDLRAADGRTVRHREPHCGRADALQRARPGSTTPPARSFPANITAGIFGFKEYPLFQAPESAKVAPKVDFSRPPNRISSRRGSEVPQFQGSEFEVPGFEIPSPDRRPGAPEPEPWNSRNLGT